MAAPSSRQLITPEVWCNPGSRPESQVTPPDANSNQHNIQVSNGDTRYNLDKVCEEGCVSEGNEMLAVIDKCDISQADGHHQCALMSAAKNNQLSVLKLLCAQENFKTCLKDDSQCTALWNAAREGHIDSVKVLFQHGANIEACAEVSSVSVNPLWVATSGGHKEVVSFFLDNQANVNWKGSDGRSVVWIAAYKGHLDILKLLLRAGATYDCEDLVGRTILHAASISGMFHLIAFLTETMDVNKKDNAGCTALYHSVYHNHNPTVKVLVSHGADSNIKADNGLTPLLCAIKRGTIDMVENLLQLGANVHQLNSDGRSSLMIACSSGSYKIVLILLKYQADINTKCPKGHSAIDIAASNNHQAIMHLLLDCGAQNPHPGGVTDGQRHKLERLVWAVTKSNWDVVEIVLMYTYPQQLSKFKEALFWHAVKYTLINELKNLFLKQIISKSDVCNVGNMALWYALCNKHAGTPSMLDILFSTYGVNKYCRNEDGKYPLTYVIENQQNDCLSVLLQNGYQLEYFNFPITPLWYALRNRHLKTLQVLLEDGDWYLQLVEEIDQHGLTPLWYTVTHGYMEGLRLILQHKPNINSEDAYGNSPLNYSAMRGNSEVVSLLLAHGADIDHRNKQGHTSLYSGIQNNHTETVKILVHHKPNISMYFTNQQTLLHLAVQNRSLECMKILLDSGADANQKDGEGWTPLFHVIFYPFEEEAIKMLLLHGASPTVTDYNGVSPLNLAIEKRQLHHVRLLLESRSISSRDMILGLVAKCGSCSLMLTLLRSGACVNQTGIHEETALHVACEEDHVEIVHTLLEYFADVNARNMWNRTPLHVAVLGDFTNIIEALLNHPNINLDEEDFNGHTPLHLAVREGHKNVCQMLLSAAIDNMCDLVGKTEIDTVEQDSTIPSHTPPPMECLLKKDRFGRTPLHYALKGHRKYHKDENADISLLSSLETHPGDLEIVVMLGGNKEQAQNLKADRVQVFPDAIHLVKQITNCFQMIDTTQGPEDITLPEG